MRVIKQIVEGHFNEFTNKEQDLSNKRMTICNKCPLMEETTFGKVCSSHKYLNLLTNKVSPVPCKTCENGCGCRLSAKTRVPEAKCPLNKW